VQWQYEALMKGSATSNRTPPHWQLPCIALMLLLA
jgi:hypothetical protein